MPPRASKGLRISGAVLVGAVVVGIGVGVALHFATQTAEATPSLHLPRLHGQAIWPAGKQAAPDFSLRDQHGRVVSPRALRGRTVVIAFMDSRCHQVCPLEGRTLAAAFAQVPPRVRPVLLVVSVNPWADTRASSRAAARKWGLAGSWHWLLGRKAELAPVWRAYKIYVRRARGDIVHSDAIYVVDRAGFERAGFIYPFLPGAVEQDLRVLAGTPTA